LDSLDFSDHDVLLLNVSMRPGRMEIPKSLG